MLLQTDTEKQYILYRNDYDINNIIIIKEKSVIRNSLITFNTNESNITYECRIGLFIDILENIYKLDIFEILTNLVYPLQINKDNLRYHIKNNLIFFNLKYPYKCDGKHIIDIFNNKKIVTDFHKNALIKINTQYNKDDIIFLRNYISQKKDDYFDFLY